MKELEQIALLISGDQKAYIWLVDTYGAKVKNMCYHYLQHEDDVQDAMQEVFIAIYTNIHKFDKKSSLSTWIYRITVNKCLEYIRYHTRKKRNGATISISTTNYEWKENQIKSSFTANENIENQEQKTILFKAIHQLPEQQKTAFLLHKIEQQSYVEVAQIMQTTLSSVEALLFRAKQNLKKILADYYKDYNS